MLNSEIGIMEISSYKGTLMMCIILLSLSTFITANKYSKNVNSKNYRRSRDDNDKEDHDRGTDFENDDDDDEPFRMKKINLLWMKAKKILSNQKLAELYADLKKHDKEEGRLKKMKADDADKDGNKEAEVLKNYTYIIHHYGLVDYNANQYNEIPMSDEETRNVNFQDPKLQSMWGRAERSGFSDEDLQILKEEFWHQQMKLNEYEFLKRELYTDDFDSEEIDNRGEDVKVDMSKEKWSQNVMNLKKYNKAVQKGYMQLEHMAASLPRAEMEFKDYRVQKLWALAKKTNWSEGEMDSFKEELKHFEHRLSKQDYYQQQLDLTENDFINERKEGSDYPGYPEKLSSMKEKAEGVKKKVRKLHNHMKTRLEKALKHTEL